MKIKDVFVKLAHAFNHEHQAHMQKSRSLKNILKALRQEKSNLAESLAETDDSATQLEIESRLKVVAAQRKKGLQGLKELKKKRDNAAE